MGTQATNLCCILAYACAGLLAAAAYYKCGWELESLPFHPEKDGSEARLKPAMLAAKLTALGFLVVAAALTVGFLPAEIQLLTLLAVYVSARKCTKAQPTRLEIYASLVGTAALVTMSWHNHPRLCIWLAVAVLSWMWRKGQLKQLAA